MKIFSAAQTRKWDQYTIAKDGVSNYALMERTAKGCFDHLSSQYHGETFHIFCGPGNNGGDGLALARLLLHAGFNVNTCVFKIPVNEKENSPSTTNFYLLRKAGADIKLWTSENSPIPESGILIDALLGTGLSRKPEGKTADIIRHINASGLPVISIDIPSGLFADVSSVGNEIVQAKETLSIQREKTAFFLAENQPFCGRITIINIELSEKFEEQEPAKIEKTDAKMIGKIFRPRSPFTHKGNFGTAAIVAGSYGMMGAAVLAAKSCMRSGVGKLICTIPEVGYTIMQTTVPEAMCRVSGKKMLEKLENPHQYDGIGTGPGIGWRQYHLQWLLDLFDEYKGPIVIDADALNVLSDYKDAYTKIPHGSIITPHPGEFKRLFGNTENDFEGLQMALRMAQQYQIYIVLKGHHTLIATPEGHIYFNTTGNAGMATAGAGDVLTGLLTGLLAQQYTPLETCLLGVYLHGLAGDIAAAKVSKEALIAEDIIDYLGQGYLQMQKQLRSPDEMGKRKGPAKKW